MRDRIIVSLLLLCTVSIAAAGERSSANYSITADTADRGGQRATSANYAHDGSAGLISGTSNSASGSLVDQSGYVAQLLSAIPVPTPTPSSVVQISGTVLYCSNPLPGPVSNVTFTLTGAAATSTVSDASGNYTFSGLPAGSTYMVTPTKTGLTPGSTGAKINTIDVLALTRHFLQITALSGCRLTAGDVNGDNAANTIDVVAIQRFYLGVSTGIANVGKYRFNPTSRTYSGVVNNQSGQNYDALIYGDVATPFAGRDGGPSQDALGNSSVASEVASMVDRVSLPNVAVDSSAGSFIAPVEVGYINRNENLVGFQGDFAFDPTVLTFESEPVQKAGLTAGNWRVSANVLAGAKGMATLRVSAYSTDFQPLAGAGSLFELRVSRVSNSARGSRLIWAKPPDDFFFIDANLNTQKPRLADPGSVTPSEDVGK